MSKDQLKLEINRVLDHLSDTALKELLAFLKNLEQKNLKDLDQDHLHKILSEDKELLSRLAQ